MKGELSYIFNCTVVAQVQVQVKISIILRLLHQHKFNQIEWTVR